MKTDLRKKAKNDFDQDFFKLINYAFFGKAMENMGKQRFYSCHNRKMKELFSIRPNYHTTKLFTENL